MLTNKQAQQVSTRYLALQQLFKLAVEGRSRHAMRLINIRLEVLQVRPRLGDRKLPAANTQVRIRGGDAITSRAQQDSTLNMR